MWGRWSGRRDCVTCGRLLDGVGLPDGGTMCRVGGCGDALRLQEQIGATDSDSCCVDPRCAGPEPARRRYVRAPGMDRRRGVGCLRSHDVQGGRLRGRPEAAETDRRYGFGQLLRGSEVRRSGTGAETG